MPNPMTQLQLLGGDLSLLKGLSQSFAALGFSPTVVQTLHEGREHAAQHSPLVAVVSRSLAAASTSDALSLPLAPGCAPVPYCLAGCPLVTLSPTMPRAVPAHLT